MWPSVVLRNKFCQQDDQLFGGLPLLARQPFLECSHEAFCNPITLGAVTSNRDPNEVSFFGQLRKYPGSKVDTLIRDQVLQFGWQEGF